MTKQGHITFDFKPEDQEIKRLQEKHKVVVLKNTLFWESLYYDIFDVEYAEKYKICWANIYKISF